MPKRLPLAEDFESKAVSRTFVKVLDDTSPPFTAPLNWCLPETTLVVRKCSFQYKQLSSTWMTKVYNQTCCSLHYSSCFLWMIILVSFGYFFMCCTAFFLMFILFACMLCTKWWFKGNFPFLPTLIDVYFLNDEICTEARISDSAREWINNNCEEGTAGRGGAVFNCPSAWRIPEFHSLRQEADKHSSVVFLQFPSSHSIFVASISCMCGLLAPFSFSISYPHSLFPFPLLPCCVLGEFEDKLVGVDVFVQMCNFCVHCIVSICWDWLPEFKGLSPQIWFACSLFVRQVSSYVTQAHIPSLAQKEARTERDKLQMMASVGFNSGFDTSAGFKVIPGRLMKIWCWCSFRGRNSHWGRCWDCGNPVYNQWLEKYRG